MNAHEPFLVDRVYKAIAAADGGTSKLSQDALTVQGMTSTKVRHFLNTLCDWQGCSYLEVGTHRGATLVAASYGNPGYYAGVDNWSEFTENGETQRECHHVLAKLSAECCTVLHETDCWQLAERLPTGMFQVYFYDGNHSRLSQKNALCCFDRAMQKPFVLIVDDWNNREVRRGTQEGIKAMRYRTVEQWEFRSDRNRRLESWWCGIYVAVLTR